MITFANALTTALAHLQAQGVGHTITVPAAAFSDRHVSIECWCLQHGLIYSREGRMVTLELDPLAGV